MAIELDRSQRKIYISIELEWKICVNDIASSMAEQLMCV